MTKIKSINISRTRATRNKCLLDLIRLSKYHINKEEELSDMMVLFQTKGGKVGMFGQTINPINPINSLGLLEISKASLIDELLYNEEV